jgi:hypothetical protein
VPKAGIGLVAIEGEGAATVNSGETTVLEDIRLVFGPGAVAIVGSNGRLGCVGGVGRERVLVFEETGAADKTGLFIDSLGEAMLVSSLEVNVGLEIKKEVSPATAREKGAVSKRTQQ